VDALSTAGLADKRTRPRSARTCRFLDLVTE
jgi:hypothetical protein